MIYNKEMKKLIDEINDISKLNVNIDLIELSDILFPKHMKLYNTYGDEYYLIDDASTTKKSDEELSWLEWDINEKYIAFEDESILKATKFGLITAKVWTQTLKEKYPNKEFEVVLSIDVGEINCILPSATLRFYHVREGYHCCSDIEKFDQPILITSTFF
ncbi:hypothetical protein [Clostridium sp. HBUAS56017]|uniref:hypothetical protein n=1 Tax=Clostridium sp. HBUAS56017 TaxID=2571128 RepID=UPI00117785C8|nr:hypothetical protein [Clostridium sp. HBUAS56017]